MSTAAPPPWAKRAPGGWPRSLWRAIRSERWARVWWLKAQHDARRGAFESRQPF